MKPQIIIKKWLLLLLSLSPFLLLFISSCGGGKGATGKAQTPQPSAKILSVNLAAGDYGLGQTISLDVEFDEVVDVSGEPQLKIIIGGYSKVAAYASGSGEKHLIFNYQVFSDDIDTDGIEATSISLNSGTIKDKVGNVADLSFTSPAKSPLVKVDGRAPKITNITSLDKIHGEGDVIAFTVIFDETVDVDTILGKPLLKVKIAGQAKDATYDSGSGTAQLVFKYTVNKDEVGNGVEATVLALNLGTIKDKAGNAADLIFTSPVKFPMVKVDGRAPKVTKITSLDKIHGEGDVIAFTVTFDETVDVGTILGKPLLKVTIGNATKDATYDSGTGTDQLVFKYTVNKDEVGNGVAATILALKSGTIKDKAGNAADLIFTSPVKFPMVKVDGRAPKVTKITSLDKIHGEGDVIAFTVTFDETVDVGTILGKPLLKVTIGNATKDATYDSGTGTDQLVFKYTVNKDEVGNGVAATILALKSGTIKDKAGNAADLIFTSPVKFPMVKVDGRAPKVTKITSLDKIHGEGDVIAFTVTFDETVDVGTILGKPLLKVTIGNATKDATYDSGTGTDQLVFKYTVNKDEVGNGVAATILALKSGTIKDKAGNAADLIFTSPVKFPMVKVDGRAPKVTKITSLDKIHGEGDVIAFTVTFDETVDVGTILGKPLLKVTIGNATKDATYDSGTGTDQLVFKYTVNKDEVGNGVAATILALKSGTIKDKAGNAADLIFTSPVKFPMVKVDGRAPKVTKITSLDKIHGEGDVIAFTVTFDETVDVGTILGKPLLKVTIGNATKDATYDSGTGTDQLVFKYTVNKDEVGNGVEATALALKSGTIKDKAGNAADLIFTSPVKFPMVKVDGRAPKVTKITSLDKIHGEGDVIAFTVTFDETVDVGTILGKPLLKVTIGNATKDATYDSGTGTDQLVFKYTVNKDEVGNGVAATILALKSGTIKDKAGNAADLIFTSPVKFPMVKVDGRAPKVTKITSLDKIHGEGDVIAFTVTFDETVDVGTILGKPLLKVTIGNATKDATYDSGTGTDQLVFKYTVNKDEVGNGVAATILALKSGTIKDKAGNAADLIFTSPVKFPMVKVDGRAPKVTKITSLDKIHGEGDVIAFTVTFDETVDVGTILGKPLLKVTIGNATKDATYDSGTGTDQLVFKYTVNKDEVGNGVEATALALKSGTIKDKAGNAADLIFTSPVKFPMVKVDGRAPKVTKITSLDKIHGEGDVIAFTVTFDETVDVGTILGKPLLKVTIGNATKDATYDSGTGTDQLVFKYTVNKDEVGNGVAATILALKSGTIKDKAGNAADLIFTSPVKFPMVKVDGRAPKVTKITSLDKIHGEGDVIAFTVTFDETVDVGTILGKPLLKVTIGNATKDATYDSGTGTDQLVFKYTVNKDEVGNGVAATILALKSGTIKDKAGNAADLIFTSPVKFPMVKVDGRAPKVTKITSLDKIHGEGDVIAFTVTFDETVDVGTILGKPLLKVTIGNATKDATYDSGTGTDQLVFKYTVNKDEVGNGVAATILALKSGTIKDKAGNAADLIFTSPVKFPMVKVDGRAPKVTKITSLDKIHGEGDVIAFTVTFDETVDVGTILGKPLLKVTIGNATKDATYDSGTGTDQLVFKYTVNKDEVGNGVAATILALKSGTIKDKAGNAADLIFTSPVKFPMVKVDGRAPKVTKITSLDKIHGEGDVIAFTVTFDETVDVGTILGKPLLKVTIGNATKDATYDSGTGTDQLVFKYTVNKDEVGNGVEATALALKSGTIKDKAGNAADLIFTSPVKFPMVKVDGRAPKVTKITSLDKIHGEGDVIAFTVTFDETVDVGTILGKPLLKVTIGNATKDATYDSGTGTDQLVFKYTVNKDEVGNGVAATILALKSGTIKDKAGNAADLIFTSPVKFPMVKVDGRAPKVTKITSLDKIHGEGDVIAFTVTFDETVDVGTILGKPLLKVTIGNATKDATYDSGTGTDQLVFKYTVNKDEVGNGVAATILALKSGTIKDKAGNAADLIFTSPVKFPMVKVDGRAPKVTKITSLDKIHGEGDVIAFTVTFDETVDVGTILGKPLLKVTIGNATKDATYDSGTGTDQLVFKYTVNKDEVGNGVAATILALKSGTIKDKAGNAADLIFTSPVKFPMVKVDGRAPKVTKITSLDKIHGEGDVIAFTVTFDETVDVGTILGKPLLKVTIGNATKDATYDSGTGTDQLVFKYTVNKDEVGNGVEATALALKSGTIKDKAGNAADLIFTSPVKFPMVKVDGRAPKITKITSLDKIHGEGDVIAFTVVFDKTVDVNTTSGIPLLKVSIGDVTKDATYDSGTGTAQLVFQYTVEAGDVDRDGVEATVLALNSGTIKDKAGNAADLIFTSPVKFPMVKVDGRAPKITKITSLDKIHGEGDVIAFTVVFDKTVDVNTTSGIPLLKVSIGDVTKDATYDSGTGTAQLVFQYTVEAGDVDRDGVEATVLALNSGTIKDKAGNAADLIFTSPVKFPMVKVDGRAPKISEVNANSGVYGFGKEVELKVKFNEKVYVTGGQKPQLDFTINGSVTRRAVYVQENNRKNETVLTFKYRVTKDEIANTIQATSLILNSAEIKDSAGNAVNGNSLPIAAQDSLLDLVRFDGKAPVVKSITSAPSIYGFSREIVLKVEFDEAVNVATSLGKPLLKVSIAGQVKDATYDSGSGTDQLTFKYKVVSADSDSDGIEATLIDLNSGTIQDQAKNNAFLALGRIGTSSLKGVEVDGQLPSITSIDATSGAYALGEEIKLLVNVSGPVTVNKAGSEITIGLNVGGSIVQAHYTAKTNKNVMEFTYTASGTVDLDGIEVVANSIKKGNSASIKSKGVAVLEGFTNKHFPGVTVNAPFDLSKASDIWFDSTDVDGDGDTTDQKAGEIVTTFYDKSGKDNHIRSSSSRPGRPGPTLTKDNSNNNNLSLFFDRSARNYLSTSKISGFSALSHTYFTSITKRSDYETNIGDERYIAIFGTSEQSSGVNFMIDRNKRKYALSIASQRGKELVKLNGERVNPPVINRSVFMSELNTSGINRIYSFSNMSDSALTPVSNVLPGKLVSMGALQIYNPDNIQRKYKGFVNEALYSNRALTLAERSVIENYLASKWNSQEVVGRNYYEGDDLNKGDYDYDVTGILKLPAKTVAAKKQNILSQTLPASSVSVARAGALLIADSASDGFLKDEGDSVFAGSKGNGATKANLPTSGVESTVRSGKVWYLDVFDNSTNSGGKIDLAFTPSLMGFDWTADAASYELLWSASDPSASTPSVTFQVMTARPSAANGIVRFNGIEAKSGYIALGLKKDTMAPSLRYAEVTGGKEITLTFDESLASSPSGFSVSGGGVNVSNTNIDTRSDNKVVLATGSDIQSASTVSYYNGAVSDITGNTLASLPNVVVGTSGADTFTLSSGSIVVAGAGDDAITASPGSDVFDYNFITDGNDTITGFDKVKDKIDLSDLLQYSNGQDISKFIAVSDDGTNTTINMDAHGRGNTLASTRDISITLSGVTGLTLDSLIKDKVLVVTAP